MAERNYSQRRAAAAFPAGLDTAIKDALHGITAKHAPHDLVSLLRRNAQLKRFAGRISDEVVWSVFCKLAADGVINAAKHLVPEGGKHRQSPAFDFYRELEAALQRPRA